MYTQSRMCTALCGLVLLLAFSIGPVLAASEDIIMTVEEPLNDDTYSGVANIRGWAISPFGMSRIELYVDDEFKTNIPLGGRRSLVEEAYPDIPGSGESGFSMAFNYSNLSQGSHTMTIRAIEDTGASKDTVINFNVARLDNSFVPDASSVNLDEAICTVSGNQIFLDGVEVDDNSYDFDLAWRAATQDFAVNAIADGGERARWRAVTAACCDNGNMILTVTIDGVTQSSSISSCSSEPVSEGFAGLSPGSNTISASAAGLCGSANFSGDLTFDQGECYRLQLELDSSDNRLQLQQYPEDCS